MKHIRTVAKLTGLLTVLALLVVAAVILAGCSWEAEPKKPVGAAAQVPEEDPEIKAQRSELSPEDQPLVAAQDFCPIQTDQRLGAMGKPIKILIDDQPVFLCCRGCKTKALANPEKTLAATEKCKARANSNTPEQ